MGLAQYSAAPDQTVKSVYYAGTDTLHTGYSLAYDAAASVESVGTGTSATTQDEKTRRGRQVVKPATANLLFFAGLVHPSSDGKVGPCMVDIITPKPREWVQAYCHVNATINSTVVKLANADYGLVNDAGTTPAGTIAVAGETKDTSTTAALAWVQWL